MSSGFVNIYEEAVNLRHQVAELEPDSIILRDRLYDVLSLIIRLCANQEVSLSEDQSMAERLKKLECELDWRR